MRGVVGLDCSGETFSCGLLTEGHHYWEVNGLNPRRALREIPGHIQYLLQNAGLGYRDLVGVGVTNGPGSFTGVRLGVTLAKTIALTADCGTWGMDTLALLAKIEAECFEQGHIAVALDARRSEVYCGVFDIQSGAAVVATDVRTPEVFARELLSFSPLRALVGAGFAAYPLLVPSNFSGPVSRSAENSYPAVRLLCQETLLAWTQQKLVRYGELHTNYYRQADIQVSGGAP